MEQLTTEQKNCSIAEMLGWKKGMLGEFTRPDAKPNKEGFIDIIPPFTLKFHSDANWQFEAIDFCEKEELLKNTTVEFFILNQNCSVIARTSDKGEQLFFWFDSEINNRKLAIFEALYQFSQYIKQLSCTGRSGFVA